MSTEHTQGSLTKEAIRLAWPAVVISLLTVGFADQIIEFCGSNEGHARHGCEILPDHHGRHDLQCIVHGNQCGTARRGQYNDCP